MATYVSPGTNIYGGPLTSPAQSGSSGSVGQAAVTASSANTAKATPLQATIPHTGAGYQSSSGILPAIALISHDLDAGKEVEITLVPERDISPYESLLITQMLVVYSMDAHSFNAFAFIKKNNLERHFTYRS